MDKRQNAAVVVIVILEIVAEKAISLLRTERHQVRIICKLDFALLLILLAKLGKQTFLLVIIKEVSVSIFIGSVSIALLVTLVLLFGISTGCIIGLLAKHGTLLVRLLSVLLA